MPTFTYDGFSFTFPDGWEDVTGLKKLALRGWRYKPEGYFFRKSGVCIAQLILGRGITTSVGDLYAKLQAQVVAEYDLPKVAAGEPRDYTINPETGNFLDAMFDDEDIVTRISIASNGSHAFVLIIQCPKVVGERNLKYEQVRTCDEMTDCNEVIKSLKFP